MAEARLAILMGDVKEKLSQAVKAVLASNSAG